MPNFHTWFWDHQKISGVASGLFRIMLYGVCLLIFGGLFTVAQAQTTDCQNLLRQSYDTLHRQAASDKQQGMFMEYEVDVTYSGGQTAHDQVKLYASESRSRLESKTNTVFADRDTQVAIIKGGRTVLITARPEEAAQQTRVDQWLHQQDSLIATSRVVECSSETLRGQQYQRVMLVPNTIAGGVKQITFWINKATYGLRQIQMSYADGYPMQTVTYTILKTDYHYSSPVFTGSAVAQVLNPVGQPVPAYATYRIEDLRTERK